MREIKFRGKNLSNGEWVFGDLLHSKGHVDIATDEHLYEVNPDTVGQFTGSKDRTGKEIYEGDIIRAYRYNPYTGEKKAYYYDVQWDNDIDTDTWGEPLVTGYEFSGADIEVVGNIFDNPELL